MGFGVGTARTRCRRRSFRDSSRDYRRGLRGGSQGRGRWTPHSGTFTVGSGRPYDQQGGLLIEKTAVQGFAWRTDDARQGMDAACPRDRAGEPRPPLRTTANGSRGTRSTLRDVRRTGRRSAPRPPVAVPNNTSDREGASGPGRARDPRQGRRAVAERGGVGFPLSGRRSAPGHVHVVGPEQGLTLPGHHDGVRRLHTATTGRSGRWPSHRRLRGRACPGPRQCGNGAAVMRPGSTAASGLASPQDLACHLIATIGAARHRYVLETRVPDPRASRGRADDRCNGIEAGPARGCRAGRDDISVSQGRTLAPRGDAGSRPRRSGALFRPTRMQGSTARSRSTRPRSRRS